MFETVQSVSGVGPRIALAMLSVMGPDDLAAALSAGDTKAPDNGPGDRREIRTTPRPGTQGQGGGYAAATTATTPGSAAFTTDGWRDQVAEALVGLGWNAKAGRRSRRAGRGDRPRRR